MSMDTCLVAARKNRNMINNVNSAIWQNTKRRNRKLFELCQQYNAEQSEYRLDSSSNDEGLDFGTAKNVNGTNFAELLDLSSDESR